MPLSLVDKARDAEKAKNQKSPWQRCVRGPHPQDYSPSLLRPLQFRSKHRRLKERKEETLPPLKRSNQIRPRLAFLHGGAPRSTAWVEKSRESCWYPNIQPASLLLIRIFPALRGDEFIFSEQSSRIHDNDRLRNSSRRPPLSQR